MELQAIYIRSYQERTTPDKHIAYAIEVHAKGRTWTVWRRYSEFEALVRDMELEVPISTIAVKGKGKSSWRLPDLPPKRAGLGSVMLQPWRAVSNSKDEQFLKERQAALEQFLRAILASTDHVAQAYRESRAFKAFLEAASPTGQHIVEGKNGSRATTDFTASSWLDEYYSLESQAKDVQAQIARRDALLDKGDTTSGHAANVQAKKLLASMVSRLTVLAKGLDELATSSKGGAALSEGELRRRTDMMAKMQDRVQLLGQMSAATSTRAAPSRAHERADASTASRTALLGTNGSGSTRQPVTRVLGKQAKQPIQETAETRALDNAGLLQLQYQEIDQQDERLTSLTAVIRRQRELATAIGVELEQQNELLDQLSGDVDNTGNKLAGARKQLRRLE